MWARTPEEAARNRHSGFVCFVHRQDAQDALDICDETDPFRVGRRIMVRWGKNVKQEIMAKPDEKGGTVLPMMNQKRDPRDLVSAAARRVQALRRNKEQGRFHHLQRGGAADGGKRLSTHELAEFQRLFRHELCAARGAICRAMAFCFENSGASAQISDLIKELLLEPWMNVSVETKVAQLYVLSDILYNSQQPGVRNAFRYRDSIEKISPDIFSSFGNHSANLGRMTRNKVAKAVSSVLAAWMNWSVYNPTFLDGLHARFEGREIKDPNEIRLASDHDEKADSEPVVATSKADRGGNGTPNAKPSRAADLGDSIDAAAVGRLPGDGTTNTKPMPSLEFEDDLDGVPLEEAIEDDIDGEPLVADEAGTDDEALATVDGDDTDGEPLGSDEDVSDMDGEPLGADGCER